jgi:hypothetical protein
VIDNFLSKNKEIWPWPCLNLKTMSTFWWKKSDKNSKINIDVKKTDFCSRPSTSKVIGLFKKRRFFVQRNDIKIKNCRCPKLQKVECLNDDWKKLELTLGAKIYKVLDIEVVKERRTRRFEFWRKVGPKLSLNHWKSGKVVHFCDLRGQDSKIFFYTIVFENVDNCVKVFFV